MSDSIPEKTGPLDQRVSRRAVVAGAAWSIPAVVLTTVTPAMAVSGSDVLTLSTPGMRLPSTGSQTVTAVLKDSDDAARPGQAVSFTGPSGADFSPSSATTDGSGTATSDVNLNTPWATPGSTVTLTAVSGTTSVSQSFTVVGANAYGVGSGASGKFGNGSTADLSTPQQLAPVFPSPIIQVAAGSDFTLVLLQDGTVWSAGANQYGQLGDGTTTSRPTWAEIAGLTGVSQIAAGYVSAYALVGDVVKAWGSNGAGALGSSGGNATTPSTVAGLSGVTQIAAGYSSGYAIVGGSLKAWGWNLSGQLGDGSTTSRTAPVQVSGLTSGVTQVAAGYSTAYAVVGGVLKAWGANNVNQIGDGTTTRRTTPVPVTGLSTGVSSIVSGANSAYALVNGGVQAWGSNTGGALGDGTTTNRATPVTVSGLSSGVTQIAAGSGNGYALVSGTIRAWGANSAGAVGDGSGSNRTTPVTISAPGATTLAANGPQSGSMFFIR